MSPQAGNIQQTVTDAENLHLSEEKAPLVNYQVTSTINQQAQAVPPPFLSGVPMVNPGNFTMSNNVPQTNADLASFSPQQVFSPQLHQQPVSSTQSVVANMAAYSTSKYNNLINKSLNRL